MSNIPTTGVGSSQPGDKPRTFLTGDVSKPVVTLPIPAQVKLTTVTATGEHMSLHGGVGAPKTVNLLPKSVALETLQGSIQHIKPPTSTLQKVPRSLQFVTQPIETAGAHTVSQIQTIQPSITQIHSGLPIIQHTLSTQPSPLLPREHILHTAQPGPISLTAQAVVHATQPGQAQPGPISLAPQTVVHAPQPGPTQPGPISLTAPQTVTMASIIRAPPTTGLPPKNQAFQAQVVKAAVPAVPKHTVLRPALPSPIIRTKPATPPILSSALAASDIRSVSSASTAQTVQITIQAKGEPNVVRSHIPPTVHPVHLSTVPKSTAVIHHPVVGTKTAVITTAVSSLYGHTLTTSTTTAQPPVVTKISQQRSPSGEYTPVSETVSIQPPVTEPAPRPDRPPVLDFPLPGFPGLPYLHSTPFFPAGITGTQVSRHYTPTNLAATLQGSPYSLPPRLPNTMVAYESSRQNVPQVFTSVAEGTPINSEHVLNVVASTNQVASAMSPGASSAGLGPNASPRPSILRKRTIEGTSVVRRTIPTPTGSETGSPRPESAPRSATSSPKPPGFVERDGNSQSSTDTANSDGPPSLNSSMDVVSVKAEPIESLHENGTHSNISSAQHSVESSPRKKPRKQLLHVSEELKDHNSSTDEDAGKAKVDVKTEEPEKTEEKKDYVDDDGIHWVTMRKRNSSALLSSFNIHWKARNNHFLRYSDVKPKEERRPTVNELSNQKSIQQKASGWKLYHLATQLDEVKSVEKDTLSDMTKMQQGIEEKLPRQSEHGNRIHELMQANKQRLKLVIDQVDEARNSLLKILDHKTRIQEIISKHHSKRQVKKKERS